MISIPETLTVNITTDQEIHDALASVMQRPVYFDAYTVSDPTYLTAPNFKGSVVTAGSSNVTGESLPGYPKRTDSVEVRLAPGVHRPVKPPFAPLNLPYHGYRVTGTGQYTGVYLSTDGSSPVTLPTDSDPILTVRGLTRKDRGDAFKPPHAKASLTRDYSLGALPEFTEGEPVTVEDGETGGIAVEVAPYLLCRDNLDRDVTEQSLVREQVYGKVAEGFLHLIYVPKGGHKLRLKVTHRKGSGLEGWVALGPGDLAMAPEFVNVTNVPRWDANLTEGWYAFKHEPAELISWEDQGDSIKLTYLPEPKVTADGEVYAHCYPANFSGSVMTNGIYRRERVLASGEAKPVSDWFLNRIFNGALTLDDLTAMFGGIEAISNPYAWHHVVVQGFELPYDVEWAPRARGSRPQLRIAGYGSGTVVDFSSVSAGPRRFPDRERMEAYPFRSVTVAGLHARGLKACFGVSSSWKMSNDSSIRLLDACTDVAIASGLRFERCRLTCAENAPFPLRGLSSGCEYDTCLISTGANSLGNAYPTVGMAQLTSLWGLDSTLSAKDAYVSLFPSSNSFSRCTVDTGLNLSCKTTADIAVATPYLFDVCPMDSCFIRLDSYPNDRSDLHYLFPGPARPQGWSGKAWEDLGGYASRVLVSSPVPDGFSLPSPCVLDVVPDAGVDASFVPMVSGSPSGSSPASFGGDASGAAMDLSGAPFLTYTHPASPPVVPRGCLSAKTLDAAARLTVPGRLFRLGTMMSSAPVWVKPFEISTPGMLLAPGSDAVLTVSGTHVLDFLCAHAVDPVRCTVDGADVDGHVDVRNRTMTLHIPASASGVHVSVDYSEGADPVTQTFRVQPELQELRVMIPGARDAWFNGLEGGVLHPVSLTFGIVRGSPELLPTTGWTMDVYREEFSGVSRQCESHTLDDGTTYGELVESSDSSLPYPGDDNPPVTAVPVECIAGDDGTFTFIHGEAIDVSSIQLPFYSSEAHSLDCGHYWDTMVESLTGVKIVLRPPPGSAVHAVDVMVSREG